MNTADNSSQLRRRIDSGATGDKVDFVDPAAAPLGTDDEAGREGPPPEPEQNPPAALPRLRKRRRGVGDAGIWSYALTAAAVGAAILGIVALTA